MTQNFDRSPLPDRPPGSSRLIAEGKDLAEALGFAGVCVAIVAVIGACFASREYIAFFLWFAFGAAITILFCIAALRLFDHLESQ
jgi:hypothetical protein